MEKHGRDQLPGVLFSRDGVKIPRQPEINAIEVSAESDEEEPVDKKKDDRDPWETLQIEVCSYRDHNHSLLGQVLFKDSFPTCESMLFNSSVALSDSRTRG